MKSTKLYSFIIICALAIPILLFGISCSQGENAERVEGAAAIGEASERSSETEGEHAAGESAEIASNESREGEGEGEHSRGEEGEHTGEGSEGSRESEGEHSSREEGEHSGGEGREGRGEEEGEHSGEGEEGHSEEGEESGTQYSKSETVTEVRRGVELKLRYDEATSTFVGTIKNVSNETARRARVEVHLSNGVELGPTTPIDLAPGQQVKVKLSAKDQTFEKWETHAEVGGSGGGLES